MPEISRFYGIVIKMYFADHHPPHFHAEYGDDDAIVEIATGGFVSGRLPGRARGLVAEWCALHRDELLSLWQKARSLEPLHRIDPLP